MSCAFIDSGRAVGWKQKNHHDHMKGVKKQKNQGETEEKTSFGKP